MHTRQLLALTTVARLKSFSKAAAELYMSQPAVSQQIRALERRVGTRLLERTRGGGVELTSAGAILLPSAHAILNMEQVALRALSEELGKGHRSICIASDQSAAMWIAATALKAFRGAYPDISASVVFENRDDALKALDEGVADLAIIGGEVHEPKRAIEVLYNEQIVLVGAPEYLSPPHPISLQDLRRERLVLAAPNDLVRRVVDEHTGGAGVRLRPSLELHGYEPIRQAIRAGLGIGFITKQAVQEDLDHEELVALPFGGTTLQYPVAMVLGARAHPSEACELFCGVVRKVVSLLSQ